MTHPPQWLACSSVTFRRQSVDRALAAIAAVGFERAELGVLHGFCDHHHSTSGTAYDTCGLKAVAARVGVTVTSVNANTGDLNGAAGDALRAMGELGRCFDLASGLGADAVCVPCGGERAGERLAVSLRRIVPRLRACAEGARKRNLRLFIEAPHASGLCRTMGAARSLIDEVGHENAQLVLDTSHVHAGGDDVATAIQALGERVGHVHLRDAIGTDVHRAPGTGEIAFDQVFAALERTRFAGDLVLELETAPVAPAQKLAQTRAASDLLDGARRSAAGSARPRSA